MIIKLCGSARFKETFDFVQFQLEKLDHTVYALTDLGFGSNLSQDQTNRVRLMEHAVGLIKLELCDAVVVINENGYIGVHTAIEHYKAKSLGKKIYYFDALYSVYSYKQLLNLDEKVINQPQKAVGGGDGTYRAELGSTL